MGHSPSVVPALRPTPLERGALVRVISPSMPSMAFASLRAERAKAVIEGLGLRCDFSRHCFEISDDGWSAGTARMRADDLHEAFADPEVGAVLCAAGGNTSDELIPYLDPEVFRSNPKPFIGRSDNVLLNAFLAAKAGVVSFNGTVFLSQFGEPEVLPETTESFAAVLMTDDEIRYRVAPTRTVGGRDWREMSRHDVQPRARSREGHHVWLREGTGTGRLVGGEVELILRTIKQGLLDTTDAVFWWDTGRDGLDYTEERLRRIADAVDLRNLRGMMIGDNPWVDFGLWREFVEDFLRREVGDVDYPVFLGGDCGHYDPVWMLPYGDQVTLDSRSGLIYRPRPNTGEQR
ncbi:LD-carboxypeptidase [Streptomyces sp. NPDC094447]|uniref:S66 peptidase family protein n=1 Tax=Streptomyces sp. NPDC094447 TaxID=3366062 RepID=UPI00381804C6